jgi:hypothetical protein
MVSGGVADEDREELDPAQSTCDQVHQSAETTNRGETDGKT